MPLIHSQAEIWFLHFLTVGQNSEFAACLSARIRPFYSFDLKKKKKVQQAEFGFRIWLSAANILGCTFPVSYERV